MNSERPVTSKSRGTCRYYNTSRGCYAGDKCKFLHGGAEKYTPYDKNKICQYYANGYCRRGADCWFKHIDPNETKPSASTDPAEEVDELCCCICYEKPVTFGLLGGCSHVFCVGCIREWRARDGKSEDIVVSGVTKQCPLCRAPSKFITPSSHFFPEGHPEKAETIARYKESMARVPCRYFQRSPANDRICPFGRDCFFQHQNEDGTPYVFFQGVDYYMREYRSRQERERYERFRGLMGRSMLDYAFDDTIASLSDIIEDPDEHDVAEDGATDGGTRSDSEDGPGTPARFVINDGVRVEDMVARLAMLLDAHVGNLGNMTASHVWRHQLAGELPVATDETLVNTCEPTVVASRAASPDHPPVHQETSTSGPSSSPASPAPDTTAERPTVRPSRAASDPIPRFSTIVDRRPRSIADHSIVSLDDLRLLPSTASDALVSQDSADIGHVQRDEEVTRETEALLNEAPEFDRRVEDAMRSLVVNLPVSSPAPELPQVDTRPARPEAPLETVHDSDPPFLTDGRGRVVWSSTTAGRHRDGRRVRSATAPVPNQQKMRREVSDPEAVATTNAEDSTDEGVSAARQASRPRVARSQIGGAEAEGETWVPSDM